MVSLLFLSFASVITLLAAAGGAYLLYARQQLKLRELELQSVVPTATPAVPEPELPAYVDATDPASVAAWKKTQTEIETSW